MSRYRFLLTRHWLTMALVAVVVVVACVLLGRWQFDRHESRAAANDLVTTNYDAAPVALDSLVEPGGTVPRKLGWRPVELSGRFVGEPVTLRNRPVEGSDSVRVLAVLETSAGAYVVVDRGWLASSGTTPPPAPEGMASFEARLRPAEPVDSRTAPEGQVFRIHPDSVLAAAGVDGTAAVDDAVLDGYVIAAAAEEPLRTFPRPATEPGSHLSYAFQWWVFAVGALVGFGILARREAGELSGRPAPVRRRSADAEAEDAIVDAQLAQNSAR